MNMPTYPAPWKLARVGGHPTKRARRDQGLWPPKEVNRRAQAVGARKFWRKANRRRKAIGAPR